MIYIIKGYNEDKHVRCEKSLHFNRGANKHYEVCVEDTCVSPEGIMREYSKKKYCPLLSEHEALRREFTEFAISFE